MKVRDVMRQDVPTVTEADTVMVAISRSMRGNTVCLPVVDKKNRLVGTLSSARLHSVGVALKVEPEKTQDFYLPNDMTVTSLMTTDIATVKPDDDLREAADRMLKARIDALPVVDGKQLVGVVTVFEMLGMLRKLLELQD